MFKYTWLIALFFTYTLIHAGTVYAAKNADTTNGQTLHIDIPVKLQEAHVVFNIDHVALAGTTPIAIHLLGLLANDFKAWDTQGEIIGVFHTNAGYVMLGDKAYNAFRHVTTGNPYKQSIVDLMKQGVQIELCGATAKANHWVNADLIPGVKVNTDAMSRLTQLGEQGYVEIKE
jgi:intracellular sulfur oxidation DsrE/DsrF family protein